MSDRALVVGNRAHGREADWRTARLPMFLLWRLAWRNLWRNARRTWLTAGSIAFAVWMLVFVLSMQQGMFGLMIDNGARLLVGHAQIQHPGFNDDPRLEFTLSDSAALIRDAEAHPAVTAVLPRAQSFALVSAGERSYGAQIMGVVPAREAAASSLSSMQLRGHYLQGPGEAFLGATLARNLGIAVGDEVVMLGTAREGGVAAAVAVVVGTFATGQAELDRTLAQIPLDDFREAWNLPPDQLHALVLLLTDADRGAEVIDRLAGPGRAGLDWTELMPEAEQTIELKRISVQMLFAMITVIVTFSVVNTFMMTVFERTPEFGMLMALGMRQRHIIGQLCVEAFWLCTLGVAAGLALSACLVFGLGINGMPLPGNVTELVRQYNIPDRVFPAFSTGAAWTAVVVMYLGTQMAVWIPALRVRRLKPVEALRALE